MSPKKQKTIEVEEIETVIALRRAGGNEDRQWEIIRSLHKSGSVHVLNRCATMCSSGDAIERELAADILGQLGWRNGELPLCEKIAPLLSPLLKDPNEKVVQAALVALGHMRASEIILSNVNLADHSSDLIRFSMASCLGLLDSPKARRALVKLSADQDRDVRNWATFGLGTQCHNNTNEIRGALFARINDTDEETRNEAILGLARRKIRNVIPILVRELEAEPDNPSPLAIEAAAELLAPELLEPLQRILETYGDPHGTIEGVINLIKNQ